MGYTAQPSLGVMVGMYTARSSHPSMSCRPEVDERHEQRQEQHQVVELVPLPHALVRPSAEH